MFIKHPYAQIVNSVSLELILQHVEKDFSGGGGVYISVWGGGSISQL